MKVQLGLVTVLALAAAGACGADPPLQSETDVVISIEKPDTDYSKFSSYALVSSLNELCYQGTDIGAGGELTVSCADLSHSTDAALLARIDQNMKDRGYVRVSADQAASADLLVTAGMVARTYWNIAERFCPNDELVQGCVGPLVSDDLSAPLGSLIITMVDGQAVDGGEYSPLWAAVVDKRWAAGAALGISEVALGGAAGDDELESWLLGIDLAFEQASYLEAK